MKISADNILKYFFMQIVSLGKILLKCQGLFSGKSKINIINMLSAEFAQSRLSITVELKKFDKTGS